MKMENKFEKLGIKGQLLENLKQIGFERPTEIQEKAIPLALAGKDIIGGSATGSGKTLAFSSAIIQELAQSQSGSVRALILTPTRELAVQVADSIKNFSRHSKLKTFAIYGGVNIDPQIRNIRQADIIVGTPGRVLDHIGRGTLHLGKVKFLVLDEMDRMFDMGFYQDVEKIISHCPRERQTMLFSATISAEIDHLSKKHTRNPQEVSVKSYIDSSQLKQVFYDTPDSLKFSLLVHLLKQESSGLVMVFCGTRRNVDFVVKNLKLQGINAQAIHGGLNQNKRTRVLDSFHGKGADILVCTDVAARGLDIKGVTHVYNYDLPNSSKEYIHRVGRTARAGKNGEAISILASRDYEKFHEVKKDESLKIQKLDLPRVNKVNISIGFARGNRGGRQGFSRHSRGRNGNARWQRKRFGSNSGSRDDNRSMKATPGFFISKGQDQFQRGRNYRNKSYNKNRN